MELLKVTAVKKYVLNPDGAERWVVVGKTRDYLVFDEFCSCKNFLLHLGKPCKHINEMKEAREKGDYETFTLMFEEYEPLRKEFLDL
ncbi:MAG: SWIM zinc finger family protein [Candidatus Odinarchaeota archaeon]